MHHVKTDKRSQKSAAAISEAMIRCVERKDYDDVALYELLEEAGIGRATFYRLFDNLDDVLVYMSDNMVQQMFTDNNGRVKIDSISKTLMDNTVLLKTLMDSGKTSCLYDSLSREIKRFAGEDDDSLDFTTGVIVGAIVSSHTVWLRHGMKETPEELYSHTV